MSDVTMTKETVNGGEGVLITSERRATVDGQTLCDELGIDDDEVAWRKRFTGFTDADAERLDALSETFDGVAEPLVEEFYDNILGDEQTEAILGRSTKSVEALKGSQAAYLLDLTDGRYDCDYFEKRARIGKIHDMLELGPKIYLGAYSVYYEGLLGAIVDEAKARLTDSASCSDAKGASSSLRQRLSRTKAPTDGAVETDEDELTPEEALDEVYENFMSVLKLVNLDQQVAMDTYIHSYSSKIEDELQRRERVTSEVRQTVDDLSEDAEQVTTRSETIRDSASVQSESTRSVAEEASSMSATVEEIAATATEVEETSKRAESLARHGQEAAGEALGAMAEVSTSAGGVASDVDQLRTRVDEIDDVVEIITDIADQTNLLALNASIEAARAGNAGEGFAVVAEEVKALAEESKAQVGEIESVIGRIQDDTDQTAKNIEQTTVRLDEGIDEVESAMDNLGEIVAAVEDTANGIREVSDATDEQATSMTEITSMMDEVAMRASEIREEVAAVSDANQRQARQVTDIAATVERLSDGTQTP